MAWKELLSTDIGLLSLFTIGFVVVMGGYLYHYVTKHMDDDSKAAK